MKPHTLSLLFISLLVLGAGCASSTPAVDQTTTNIAEPQEKQSESLTDVSMQEGSLAAQYSEAVFKTNKGDITVEFYGQDSPKTVENFLKLANDGFYNGTKFHRVIADFMIQGGDPNSKGDNELTYGTGGPGYTFDDEFNTKPLVRGSLAMANAGPNTNGSQFFIVTAEATPWLDGRHTNFGQVTQGMNVVDAIEGTQTNNRDLPLDPIVIESIELK